MPHLEITGQTSSATISLWEARRGGTLPTSTATAYQTIATSASSPGEIEAKRRELSSVGVGRRPSARGCVLLDGPGRPGLVAHVARRRLAGPARRRRPRPQGPSRRTGGHAWYEHPLYTEFALAAPAVGEQVALENGDGEVGAHQVPADSAVIRMKANGSTRRCSSPPPAVLASFSRRVTPAQTQRPPRKGRIRRRRPGDEEN